MKIDKNGQSRGLNRGNGSKIVSCKTCGKKFHAFKSDNKKYCSPICYHVSPTRGRRPKNRIKKECDWCGKSFERPATNFKDTKHFFCSQSCCGQWNSENGPTGENHHSWLGGYSPKAYRRMWHKTKKQVKKRAKDICEICGQKHELMDVHHKIPVRLNIDLKITNDIKNLQYLCRPCHIEADKKLRGGYSNQKILKPVNRIENYLKQPKLFKPITQEPIQGSMF